MAEDLTTADVEQFTKGRLSQTDPGTVRALNAALVRVRRYCGWHVSPVRGETLTLDRPCSPLLILPTLKVVTLTSITVDGVDVDLTDVMLSGEAPGVLATRSNSWGGYWTDSGFGVVEIELEHGFTAAEAEDWREAVLSLIDQASMNVGTGRTGPLISKRVDDVDYHWSGLPREVEDAPLDKSILSKYRLPPFA